MTEYFRAVEVNENGTDEPVTYVGCYILKWGKVSQPSVGFVPVEDTPDLLRQRDELSAKLKRSDSQRDELAAACRNALNGYRNLLEYGAISPVFGKDTDKVIYALITQLVQALAALEEMT